MFTAPASNCCVLNDFIKALDVKATCGSPIVLSSVTLATMRPFLSVETSSFGVFKLKFNAWCVTKKIEKDEDQLKVLPALIDDKLLQPILAKFSLGTTTLKSAMDEIENEYLRQSKPSNPEEEFQQLRSAPESVVDDCERLIRLASYLNLPDSAVKHRLFNSLSSNLQQATMSWLEANPKGAARDLANFVSKFPPEKVSTTMACSAQPRPRPSYYCEYCKKDGHTRDRCFKLRTCYRCGSKGHISKFCPKNEVPLRSVVP